MKKLLILIAFILLATSNTFAATSVISGMEDTFKRTRGESFRAFYNSVLSHKIFGGMDAFMKQAQGELYFVSDGYDFLDFMSHDLVKEFNVKPKEIVSREPFAHASDFAYKYNSFKRIIESSKDNFILVGNDKGIDQEVFAQIKNEFPERILDMYIHVVKNEKKLKSGMTPYHTAFDIAVSEYSKARFDYDKVKKVGKTIFSEEKFHKVFPLNAHCPKEQKEIKTKSLKEFDILIGDITKKTLEFCNG